MSNFPWRQWSPQSPGLQVDGFKACPFCDGINLHFPTSSLIVASSGRPPNQLADDIKIYQSDPAVRQFSQPGQQNIPLDHFTQDPLDSITGFPTYFSWRCLDCNRSFESPAFVPGGVHYDSSAYVQAVEVSGFTGEAKGTTNAQF
jgi:hypothetical protein